MTALFAFVLKLVTGAGGVGEQLRLARKDVLEAQSEQAVLDATNRLKAMEASVAAMTEARPRPLVRDKPRQVFHRDPIRCLVDRCLRRQHLRLRVGRARPTSEG